MERPDKTKFLIRLNQHRTTGEFCDAQITSRDGKEFMVHIPVLAAASKHFKRIFTSDFKEAIDGKVTLDMDADIVELLLKYMYTYDITIDESIAIRLLPEARYLQLSGLKRRCAELLLANVTPSNCIEMWSFACLYFCKEMKERAWKMMCINFNSLIHKPEFFGLEKDDLLAMLRDESIDRRESKVYSGVRAWVMADRNNRGQHVKELLNKDHLVNVVDNEPLTEDMQLAQLHLRFLQCVPMDESLPTRTLASNWEASGRWTETLALDVHMICCSAVLFDGRIYCAWKQVAELSQGGWCLIAPPSEDIDDMGWKLCVVDDSMYAVGRVCNNWDVYQFVKELEVWILVHRAFRKDVDIASATAFDSRICVADESTRTIQTFDPTQPDSGFVRLCAFPVDLMHSFTLCVVDGRLMTVGGRTRHENEGTNSDHKVHIFDSQTISWITGPSTGEGASRWLGAAECGGRLVTVGGYRDGITNRVETLVDGEWKPLPSLKDSRSQCGVVVVGSVILVIGGLGAPQSVEMLSLGEEGERRREQGAGESREQEREGESREQEREEMIWELGARSTEEISPCRIS